MFAFENWHSALEMKLYIQRFIHHIGGLPDFSALKFTQYNQCESLILPSVYDIRVLLDSTVRLMDGKKPIDMKLGLAAELAKKNLLSKIAGTVIEDVLKEHHVI